MTRKEVLEFLDRNIGRKKLIWFGTRGEDAQPLLSIPQFSEIFSLIAPLRTLSIEKEVCLEYLTRRRVDLDSYSLDTDSSQEAMELRASLLQSLRDPAVVVAYRPLAFLSSVYYPRRGHVDYLGLFHERQAPFEHKPWVETELQSLGVQTVPWKYFSDEDWPRLEEELDAHGSLVLRRNRSDGGAGLTLVKTQEQLADALHPHPEGFFAAAPFLSPNVPLNVNCCVFADGSVSLHGPSIQLIGLENLTTRPFGYCGNDFGAVQSIDAALWNELEEMLLLIGKWLLAKGYIGAFGVDAMVCDGRVFMTEINPRFQGSSVAAALLDSEMGRPDVFSSHIAAFLGSGTTCSARLGDLVKNQPAMAQILVHNTEESELHARDDLEPSLEGARLALFPSSEVSIAKEAVTFKAFVRRRITQNGLAIDEQICSRLAEIMRTCFFDGSKEVSECPT